MSARHRTFAFASAALAIACGSTAPSLRTRVPLQELRRDAPRTSDGEIVGRWALAELFDRGGDAGQAVRARNRLDVLKAQGLYASLGAAAFDEAHGEPGRAAEEYVHALVATRSSDDPDASLVGWYATHHLLSLRGEVADLYTHYRSVLEDLASHPGRIGWRAVAELDEWSSAEIFDKAEATGDAYDALVAKRLGCASAVRLAGPFGHGSQVDRRRSFPAEKPGPWPSSWPEDPTRGSVPHILKSEQHRCLAASAEQTEDGVFYVETFFTTTSERDMLVAVQGALRVWVDDTSVLERDLREWGVWQRFGAALHLGAGRHRVVARVMGDASSVRLLNLDGTAAGLPTDLDAGQPYSQASPGILPDPNVIDGIVRARSRRHPAGRSASTIPTLEAILAAYVAHIETMDDVASVLLEPIVTATDAPGLALEQAAIYAKGDPAFPEDVRSRTQKDLHTRALARDPRLFLSRQWLILDDAEQRGLVEAVEPIRKLADAVPNEPQIRAGLARVYARLGWRAERASTLTDLAKRFPDDIEVLRLYLEALDEDGPLAEADKVAARIERLDPDSEVSLDRRLARHDWKGAIVELRRLGKRRPDRKEIAGRIADVLERAGDPSAAAEQLSSALAKTPEDATARFRLADRAYARGDKSALRRALADALQVGAKTQEVRDALDLLEGATDLAPYRRDGKAVIRQFEAWERSGKHMDGNAARVLDYAAVWVHPDASSEMLEHEILRIQSQEAIGTESEQAPPTGLVLTLRVIKPDGSVLEPEPVPGKPTLTMPHLEVGDYIEIEHVTPEAGDGQRGRRFRGPHWFFREADKGYWQSEFVTITPKDKPLEIEVVGRVPPPKVREMRTFLERRWRVDLSPPAPEEPDSPRPTEFLPSVRIGWGVSLDDAVARLVDTVSDETPLDPRLYRIAESIVQGVPQTAHDKRAQLVYDDVLARIQDGQETDGRRVVTGRAGSRQAAYQHLMRQLGMPLDIAVVKNRLAMPPTGKMSEVEGWDGVALRLTTEHGPRWLTVREKFAPFGYVPAELRGQPAILLVAGTPHDRVPNGGSVDSVTLEGRATLHANGAAEVELTQGFAGKIGITMRNVLDKVPASQLNDFIEGRLLSRNLPGARLHDLKIENKESLSSPLLLRTTAEVAELARPDDKGLTIKTLFPMHLAQLAALPSRQTPLLIGAASHVEVRFEIVVPESMRMPTSLPTAEDRDGERVVSVKDAVHGHAILLDRMVDIPAGRVQPGDDYARFVHFVQNGDALLEREIVLGAGKGGGGQGGHKRAP